MPSTTARSLTLAHIGFIILYAALALVQVVVPAVGFSDPAAASTASSAHRTDTQRASFDPPSEDTSQRPSDPRVDAAERAGCSMASTALRATREAHIPLYVGCAFLQQEGGRNVFGHDPTVFAGAGEVTRSKYLAYKEVRERTGAMQGVGPMQLTWSTYQDQADRLGGAWKPYPNMLVGFRRVAALHRATGSWTTAAHEYNGGGPMAAAYAAEMAQRLDRMRSALG